MKSTLFLLLLCLLAFSAKGQLAGTALYSESFTNGIRIQNSFPKGGPYTGATKSGYGHSYLVFYTRVVNETEAPITLQVSFDGTPFAIPDSPDTFMKVLLPPETMTAEKRGLFSYGINELSALEGASQFKKTLQPKEECFFYTVGFFYRTSAIVGEQDRGGNRAEYVLKGETLFFNLRPQVDELQCGSISVKK